MNPSEIVISIDPSHKNISDYGSVLEETSVGGEVAQFPILEN